MLVQQLAPASRASVGPAPQIRPAPCEDRSCRGRSRMARPATITALPTPAKIDSDAEDGDQAGGMFDDDNGIADF